MTTITIPNKLMKTKELVVIPRTEYAFLLRLKKEKIREVTLTTKQKKAIQESEKELRSGHYVTLDELEQSLARPRSKTRS